MTTQPKSTTADGLKELVSLGQAEHLYLSVYLPTDPSKTTTEATRLQLASLLEGLEADLQGSAWEKFFQEEKAAMEAFVLTLRPGGRGLAVLSSRAAREWHAAWLPQPVRAYARFGHGAYVLPLMDILDEMEPVCLAMIERSSARLLVVSAGSIVETKAVQSDVPRQQKTAGRESGGRGAGGLQGHVDEHERVQMSAAAQEGEPLQRRFGFRRIVLGGTDDARGHFKRILSKQMSDLVIGEIPVHSRATDHEVLKKATEIIESAERQQEKALVDEVVTRASKQQGAVAGLDPTLWALNHREMHLLVLAGESDRDGRYCQGCDFILPLANAICPQCSGKTFRVNLWEKLPGFAMRRRIGLEVVHGEAASTLWRHDGLGGQLKPTPR